MVAVPGREASLSPWVPGPQAALSPLLCQRPCVRALTHILRKMPVRSQHPPLLLGAPQVLWGICPSLLHLGSGVRLPSLRMGL